MIARLLLGIAAVAVMAGAASLLPAGELAMPGPAAPAPSTTYAEPPAPPLAGRTVVLDPGHQLGNRNFPAETAALVDAGGFLKPCNTTGTSTVAGYPEATLTMAVARLVRRRLVELGATVVMTRDRNSHRLWGPCIDKRGRAGNRIDADLKLSIHADGVFAGRGFHVIAPPSAGRTTDIARPSRRLAHDVRRELAAARLPFARYVGGGDGLDIRSDLGTLNWSDVPAVVVELGNMQAARDARLMTSDAGRERYARALVRAVLAYCQTRT